MFEIQISCCATCWQHVASMLWCQVLPCISAFSKIWRWFWRLHMWKLHWWCGTHFNVNRIRMEWTYNICKRLNTWLKKLSLFFQNFDKVEIRTNWEQNEAQNDKICQKKRTLRLEQNLLVLKKKCILLHSIGFQERFLSICTSTYGVRGEAMSSCS